jgi:hypothetical protein
MNPMSAPDSTLQSTDQPQETPPEQRSLPRWLGALVLTAFGVGFAGILILIILMAFPQFRPGYIQYTVRMGDVFYNHPEWVAVPDNPDEVLSLHWIGWDADGFRIPARQSDQYEILALGDSYTEAANAARPWPDALAEATGLPVRNLGFRGYGPVEQVEVLRRYGVNSGANTVILGFFEGNDLADIISAQDQPIRMPSEVEDYTIIPTDFDSIENRDERYPMTVAMNGERQPIAFFEWYVWSLNTTYQRLERSRNVELFRAALSEMRGLVPDTCFVLAYFPSKEHIYVPYLTPESQAVLMQPEKVFERVAPRGETLSNRPAETSFAELLDRLSSQRDVIRDVAAEQGIPFFDATPALQAAAAEGQMVYYTYDTHWNQAGHDLVGTALAAYLETQPCSVEQ